MAFFPNQKITKKMAMFLSDATLSFKKKNTRHKKAIDKNQLVKKWFIQWTTLQGSVLSPESPLCNKNKLLGV